VLRKRAIVLGSGAGTSLLDDSVVAIIPSTVVAPLPADEGTSGNVLPCGMVNVLLKVPALVLTVDTPLKVLNVATTLDWLLPEIVPFKTPVIMIGLELLGVSPATVAGIKLMLNGVLV
jgi:hypothetical protein